MEATLTAQAIRRSFDWGSKTMIAIYAVLATSALWATGLFLIGGKRVQVRLINKPTIRTPKPMVSMNLEKQPD